MGFRAGLPPLHRPRLDASVRLFFGCLNYKMSVARKAYFKHISQEQIDADQASALLSLGSRVTAVESGKADVSALDAKASVAYVDSSVGAVASDVAGKLDASVAQATYATAQSVLAKADQSYVEGALLSKANSSDLLALQDRVVPVENQLSGLNSALNGKVDVTQHQARISNENAWIAAVKEAIFIESAPGSAAEFDYSALGITA
jgi:hypothetical protein